MKACGKGAPDFVSIMRRTGYTMVPHSVFVLIVSNDFGLSKNEMQVLLFLIRKCWGYQRWRDRVSQSQIADATGLDKSTIYRCLANLRKRGILERTSPHSWSKLLAAEWRIECDTTKWRRHPSKRGQSAERVIHVNKEEVNRAKNLGVDCHGTRDTLRDTTDIYTATAKKEAQFLKRLRIDGRFAIPGESQCR